MKYLPTPRNASAGITVRFVSFVINCPPIKHAFMQSTSASCLKQLGQPHKTFIARRFQTEVFKALFPWQDSSSKSLNLGLGLPDCIRCCKHIVDQSGPIYIYMASGFSLSVSLFQSLTDSKHILSCATFISELSICSVLFGAETGLVRYEF